MKAGEVNSRLIDKFALVLNTCAYRITAGDTSIMDACDRFENIESRHFEQILNETRPHIDKILLD
jgi:hypothetical protein